MDTDYQNMLRSKMQFIIAMPRVNFTLNQQNTSQGTFYYKALIQWPLHKTIESLKIT